jgi:hypothetical protein
MCRWDRVSVRRAPLDGALPGPSRAKRRWGTIGSLSRQDLRGGPGGEALTAVWSQHTA